MRNYERLMLVAVLGAVVAYLAGLETGYLTGNAWAGSSVTFAVTTLALYVGWTWAQHDGGQR